MASFRVTLHVGVLAPGVRPETVLPELAAAAAEFAIIEASELQIVAHTPRIVIRFSAEDNREAILIAGHITRAGLRLAQLPQSIITRRVRGRWEPLAG